MKEKINLFAEMIYNFLIVFWTIFTFLLMYAFGIDDNDGVGIYMSIISIIIYLIILQFFNYLALYLFVFCALRADNHNFAISLDYSTLITNRLN